MMHTLTQRFARLDAKARLGLLLALLLFMLLEIWLLGLRGPWQQWRKAQAERQTQAQVVAPDLSADLDEARSTLDALQAQAEALQTAHKTERVATWRQQLQPVADQHQVTVEALSADEVADALPRINLAMSGRFADVWAVQQHLTRLDMPLQTTQWMAKVQADGRLHVRIEAVPSAAAPASAAVGPLPLHDPFGSVRRSAATVEAPAEVPPKLRALVAAGQRSMVVVGDQVVEIGGLIQGYRLTEVHEDRALFVKQGRAFTARLDSPSSP